MKTRTIATALVVAASTSIAQNTSPDITVQDLRSHVVFLASDELEGRGSGTRGNEEAAGYIASQFERFGLEQIGDDGTYFQKFDFVSGVVAGPSNLLRFSTEASEADLLTLTLDQEFRPMGFSTSGEASGPVVFAGYGISAPDQGYDDYENLEAGGKIVVVLRYSPEGDNPHSDFGRHATFRSKAQTAREHGAAALIIVSAPADDPDDELVPLGFDQSTAGSGIPVISMKHAVLDRLLASFNVTTASLQDSMRTTGAPVTLGLDAVVGTVRTDVNLLRSTTSNVVGYLPYEKNQDEREVLVIGAHMDHLGFGGPGSGSLVPGVHEIHNGADDNASGTAGLLELAEAFSAQDSPLPRGIVFIAFSGEELGTLGSAHYVSNPPISLERTVAMINMDMIGRLQDSALTVYGTGTSEMWDSLLDTQNEDGLFRISRVEDGFGPSDHSQFYGKDVPVLFFFTGTHDDYHKPSDDADRLNYEGERDILRMIRRTALEIVHADERPSFVRVQSASQGEQSGRVSFRVTLGVVPDYASEAEGMKIGGVKPGGPADKAGLQGGDIIVGMNGRDILNIYDYMGILGDLRVGDEVEVVVMRDGDRMSFQVTMTRPN